MPKPDFSNGLYVRGRRDSKYRLGDLSHVVDFKFLQCRMYVCYELRFGPINGKSYDYLSIFHLPNPLRRCVLYCDRHYYKYLEKIK